MISLSKQIIYIHLPKTGGYTIKKILDPYSPDTLKGGFPTLYDPVGTSGMRMWDARTGMRTMHPGLEFYEATYPDVYDKFTKFTVVRNPWDRLHSYVMWLNRGTFDREKFIKALNYQIEGWFKSADEISQLPMLKDSNGEMSIDRVFKYDNFREDLKKFFDEHDIEYGNFLDTKINSVSKSRHYSEDYDEEMIRLVREANAEEIEYFNFNFEDRR